MINSLGILFSIFLFFVLSRLIFKGIVNKKITPILLVLSIIILFMLSYNNKIVFVSFYTLLLLPNVVFLMFVIYYFYVSVINKKKPIETNRDYNNHPFISILIAVHNEEDVIEKTINNLLSLNYDKELYDINIIDDFSNDSTLDILKGFGNKINLIDRSINPKDDLIRGKPAGVNDNINSLKGDLVCIIDADSLLEKDFLLKTTPYFKDEEVAIVQGRNKFYNEKNNLISRLTSFDLYSLQHSVYVPLDMLGFGMFEGRAAVLRKDVFKEVGGFDPTLPAEDFDYSYRVGLKGYKVIYERMACSEEQITETPKEWLKQRRRWLSSHVMACFKNLNNLYNSRILDIRTKVTTTYFILSLLFSFTFNLFGPLILIDNFKHFSGISNLFFASFTLTVTFFCLTYIVYSKRIGLLFLLPVMILYYYLIGNIITWVFLNEKILKLNVTYEKAIHRKPIVNEI